MIPLNESPVINASDLSMETALKSIDTGKLGFTLVVNQEGKLDGLISNADIRKSLLKHLDDLNGIEFVARIDVEKDKDTDDLRNVIKMAITKDQKDYVGHDSGYYAGTTSSTASWSR